MNVTQAETIDEVWSLWENLLSQKQDSTIFLTPWWQHTWWKHFGTDFEQVILVAKDGMAPVGIAPLTRKNGKLTFFGSTDLFDYHDFIVPQHHEELFFSILFEYLVSMEWESLDLESIRDTSPTMDIFPTAAESVGMSVKIEEEDVSPAASLQPSWEDYLAGLSKKDRHELKRKIRRLNRSGQVTNHTYKTVTEARDYLDEFFRLHKASSPDKQEFMTTEREAFFKDAVKEAAERELLRLEFLELDGVRIASCLGFDYGNAYLLYNSGYDPDYYDLSVGIVSKSLAIKQAIESGKSVFDFLRGSERYKYHLGAQDHHTYRLSIRR